MSTRQAHPNKVLSRAFAASSALAVGVLVVTGVFIDKIVSSARAATSTGTGSSTTHYGRLGSDSGRTGQLTVPQQNQAPAGGSHGS
jgi:hypothetical protein